MTLRRRRRRPPLLVALAVLVLLGLVPGARAQDELVPGACQLHPTQAVNPGCIPALTADGRALVEGAVTPEESYPDLRPDVTEALVYREPFFDFETGEVTFGPPELAFDTRVENVGLHPMDLLTDDATDPAGSTVSQCVAWTSDFICRARRQVGGFTWHAAHGHFHFEDFATYQLRRLAADGRPDYSPAGLVAVSEKVSFCLLDAQRVRDDARPVARYTQCDNLNQGISPGWTDIYGYFLDGQQFPLTGLVDGRYAIVVDLDPASQLWETDDVHNRVEVTIEVALAAERITVLDRRWP